MSHFFIGVITIALVSTANAAQPTKLSSQHAIVIRDDTGSVLLEKSADVAVPIASLTKLMTAMVVLDSHPDMQQTISIKNEDVDELKHSMSHIPIGTTLTRSEMLHVALMASDNRAAASLARTYPGGVTAFISAVDKKIHALGMHNTVIREPTGLSPENKSTAADLAKMAVEASKYPEIERNTTARTDSIRMNGHPYTLHNTNRLVGAPGWNVLLSKTGFTNEAGHCLIMRILQSGVRATLVLLNAGGNSSRTIDAQTIRRILGRTAVR